MAGGRRMNVKKVQIAQVATIVLLLLLLAAIVVAEAVRTGRSVKTETAALVTVTETIRGNAYVVREETVLTAPGAGPVRYAAPNGGAVGYGDLAVTVYPGEGDDAKQIEGARLLAEIEQLQTLGAAAAFSPEAYEAAYLALMREPASAGARLRLHDALVTLGGAPDAAEIESAVAEREAAFADLVRLVADRKETRTAPFDGYLCRAADGLETQLTPAVAETLTPAGLSALLASPVDVSDAVGKVVKGTFSLLLPLTHAEADALAVGAAYTVAMRETGETLTMTLSGLKRDESGALAHLTGDAAAVPVDRLQPVTLTAATRTGIRVPQTALIEENGAYYVFVAENGKAVRRQVSPLYFENGYCLSDPAAGAGYLAAGDAVPLTHRRLYEGKTVR